MLLSSFLFLPVLINYIYKLYRLHVIRQQEYEEHTEKAQETDDISWAVGVFFWFHFHFTVRFLSFFFFYQLYLDSND